LRVARQVTNPGDKAVLLEMAERWRELSEKNQEGREPNGE
jgi:hypothetical protein